MIDPTTIAWFLSVGYLTWRISHRRVKRERARQQQQQP